MENSNKLIVWALAMTFGFMVIELLIDWSLQRNHQVPNNYNINILGSLGFCFFIAHVIIIFGFSRIFSLLNTKQKRISYLTLPATNAERFLAALLYVLIVFPLCVFLSFLMGDTLRMLIDGISRNQWFSCISLIFNGYPMYFHFGSWANIMDNIHDISILLWICSLYILGGTWFRKHAFFIVTAGLMALLIAIIWSQATFTWHFSLATYDATGQAIDVSPFIYPVTIAILAATLLNIWLSYRIFKNFQIITSKWTNI